MELIPLPDIALLRDVDIQANHETEETMHEEQTASTATVGICNNLFSDPADARAKPVQPAKPINARQEWERILTAYMSRGMTRQSASLRAAREYPDLQKLMVLQAKIVQANRPTTARR